MLTTLRTLKIHIEEEDICMIKRLRTTNRTVNGKGNAETVDYLYQNWNRKQACYFNIEVKFFTSVIKK